MKAIELPEVPKIGLLNAPWTAQLISIDYLTVSSLHKHVQQA